MNEERFEALGIILVKTGRRLGEDCLFDEERAFVAKACLKRIQDFATGRFCARRAMERLGIGPVPIPVAADRAPVWPDGVVGSITHTEGMAAAAVARREKISGIGIDAQWIRKGRFNEGMKKMVLPREEEDETLRGTSLDEQTALHLVFSMKESLYKCLNPVVKRFFGFEDALLTRIDESELTFTLKLVKSLGCECEYGRSFHGFYDIGQEHVFALLALENNTVA